MAVYVVRMQVIGRSAGRSATAAAAYRSGEQVRDERTGKVHDYTGKTDIYDSEILKPENAPPRMGDRTSLWNEVEKTEKRKDAQLSREFLIALPAELNHYQRQELTRDFVQEQFVDKGMIADICYHDFNSHNPHAHIMLTMRSVDEDGFGKKQREWNKREQLQQQREAWARHANAYLERAGCESRIDHRSLKEQGSDRQPQPKLGSAVMNMEAKGMRTEKGDEYRRVNKENRDLERQQAQREKVQVDIAAEQTSERAILQPEVSAISDVESELSQLQGHKFPDPLAHLQDPGWVEDFVEAMIQHREAKVLSESPMMDELSSTLEAISETTKKLSAKTAEVQELIDERISRAELDTAQPSAPPIEKKQEPVKRQERSKQRQKKQAKERDQEMDM